MWKKFGKHLNEEVKNDVNVGAPVDQSVEVIESVLITKSSGSNLLNAIVYILVSLINCNWNG